MEARTEARAAAERRRRALAWYNGDPTPSMYENRLKGKW